MNDDRHIQADQLCPEDRQALDALVAGGFDPNAVEPPHADRARRIAQWCGLLDHLPAADPPENLTERTLAAIQRARQEDRFAQQIQSMTGGDPGWRWREVLTVAAMLLIGVSLLIPIINHSNQAARQFQCRNNLAAAGMGFGSYANANNGQLPALRTHAGDAWWDVNRFNADGTPRSNSAHVFLLIRRQHVEPDALQCPSNPTGDLQITPDLRDFPSFDHISFSYQNMFTEQRPTMYSPTIALLTDKNPLFLPGKYRDDLPTTTLSDNHADLGGQNVLLSNGQVIWNPSPVLSNGDNLWQIRGRTEYEGNETPAEWFDSFLVP